MLVSCPSVLYMIVSIFCFPFFFPPTLRIYESCIAYTNLANITNGFYGFE